MSKKGWLLAVDARLESEFLDILPADIDWQSFSDSRKALDSLDHGATPPQVIVSDATCVDAALSLANSHVPLFVTTDNLSYETALQLMDAGVEDLFDRTTPPAIIAAKIAHRLNGREEGPQSFLRNFEVDNIYRRISSASGHTATFTSKEFQIMMAFGERRNSVMTRQELIEAVWGKVKVGQKTLDVHLFNIRKKIATIGLEIRFEPPHSYRIIHQSDTN